jgi:dTDP-4-dehydrorhamnose reductase
MNILVTGATGFLGRAVMARLARDHAITGWGHAHTDATTRVDLRDAAAVRAALDAAPVDAVIHTAAYRDPDFCEAHPEETDRLNVGATRTLCAALPVSTQLIFISTDYVFDGERPPYTESSPRAPIQEYGRSKQRAEDLVRARPGSLIVRMPLLVGAGADFASSGFLAQILAQHLRRAKPHACDDVLVRYPTWIEDVAEALAFLLERDATGVIHMSGAEALTRYGAVRAAAQVLGLPCEHIHPSTDVVARAAPRPRDSALSTAALRALGFTRFTPFPDVVRAFMRRFPEETKHG